MVDKGIVVETDFGDDAFDVLLDKGIVVETDFWDDAFVDGNDCLCILVDFITSINVDLAGDWGCVSDTDCTSNVLDGDWC